MTQNEQNGQGRGNESAAPSLIRNIVRTTAILLIIIFFVVPIIRLVLMSFIGDDGFTSEFYREMFSQDRTYEVLKNTLIVVVGSTVIAAFLGVLFAWLLAYTDVRFKNTIQLFVFLPFIIPSYITSLAWVEFFGPSGTLNSFMSMLGLEQVAWDLYSMSGLVFVMGISHFPLVYLFTVNVFRRIPREMELAGRSSGAGTLTAFRKIVLPMALPGIVGGAFIAFLGGLDNFGIPAFLGTPADIPVLSTYIYQQIIGFGTSTFNTAAVMSVVLGIIALAGMGIQWLFLRRSKRLETTTMDYTPRHHLGKKRLMVESVIWLFFIVTGIFPLLSMASTSFLSAYGLDYSLETLTFKNYSYIFTSSSTVESLTNSVKLASVTTIIGILIGTMIAYYRVRKADTTIKLIEGTITVPYALPGTVLALAMIFTWMEPIPGWNPGIYGSALIMYIAYITRFLVLQVRSAITAFQQLDTNIEEASRISGTNGWPKWRKIMVPLITPGVLSGALLVFLSALTELTVSALLYSSTTKTIGVTILSFQQSGYTLYATAFSSMIVLLIVAAYCLLFIVQAILNRKVNH
nr:iron ABC transporter permease [Salinicoccus hispanicus]